MTDSIDGRGTALALVENNDQNNEKLRRIPQKHGGALNSGGTKGNKGGGRPKKDAIVLAEALAAELVTETTLTQIKNVLGNSEHKQYGTVLGLALDRAYGKAKQTVDVTSKEDKRLVIEFIPFTARKIG
jgi:hypothetical protein